MNFKKTLMAGALTVAAVAGLASCGKKTSYDLSVCLASTPDQMDPAKNSSVDGATYAIHAFSGLVRYVPDQTKSDGSLVLAPDLCTELPNAETTSDGKVKYTFTLRDGITFSDGTEITASDFVYSWNRAASYSVTNGAVVTVQGLDADYGYMFDCIDGYAEGPAKEADKFSFLNVTAVDDDTLEVVLPVNVPYFMELCAFPAYAVLKNANDWNTIDINGAWAKNPSTLIASGAYTMTEYKEGVHIVFTKNPNYWDSANITQNTIEFRLSDDDSAVYGQYLTGEITFVDSIAQSLISQVKNNSDYHVMGQLGTYYVSWNINSACLGNKGQEAEEEIRQAISLLINRQYICDQIGEGQTPSTGFIGAGLTDPLGGEFVDHNGVNGDGAGYVGNNSNYEANKTKALEILAKYYTVSNGKVSGLSLNYLYNTNTGHETIAQIMQSQLSAVGITLNVSNEEWNTFLNTRKLGNYDVARNGWLADYNDPVSFLDMWITESGNNDSQFGKGASANYTYSIDLTGIGSYGLLSGNWAETYDVLINLIKSNSDTSIRYALMHKAEDLLMSTGCITPIYNYVDTYLQSESLTNVYVSPLGYKYFMWSSSK